MNCPKCSAQLVDGALFCHMCGKKQVQEKKKALKRANGTGTVYKLQGNRRRPWVAARNKVVLGYYERKTDALEALGRSAGKEITERYNMTFREVYEEWKKEHFSGITKAAADAYENSFKMFSPLHNVKFRNVRTADLQDIIDSHAEKKEAVKKYKQLASQLSKWAMREEIITTNFSQFLRLPSVAKKEKPIFTDAEIKKIEADGSETARIICMLLSTGMRIGELFSLPLADYHGSYVIGGSKTDAGRNRVIPIRPEGRPHFEYFALHSQGMEKLLDSFVGNKSVNNFRNRDYKDLMDRLGIAEGKTPHSTRHTYASRAAKEGMPPELLQKILGHADFSTTANIYTHVDIETLVKAVEGNHVTDSLLANT